jgi:hypothetical protein
MTTRDDDIRRNDPSAVGGYSTGGSQRIADGMTVYDINGDKIGTVSGYTTSSNYFKLEKGMLFPHDYYVPMSAVSRLDPDGVYLNVRKDDIKNRGWDNPPVGGQQRNDSLDPNDEPRL